MTHADDKRMNAHTQLLRSRRKRPTLRDLAPAGAKRAGDDDNPLADLRRQVFEEYVAELALDRPLAILLELVLEGARGPILCHGLRTDAAGLLRFEKSFAAAAGKSVYVCAVDVLEQSARRRRSTFPTG